MRSTHTETDLTLVVSARQRVADDVVVLELGDREGAPLPEWSPGAHVDLQLPNGLTRQYSLSGSCETRDRWRIGVLREPGGRGGSEYIHDALHVGDVVPARGPRNNFALDSAARYLFIAGGIGITPLLPMIEQAHRAGADWNLIYGGRTRTSMAFLDELEAYGSARVTVSPQDETGLLDLPTILAAPTPETLVYCCGPEPLLLAVERECASWPAGGLRVERFAPKEQVDVPAPTAFEVELAVSGLTLTVPPDRSILDVVREAGVDAPSSCGEGTCGTCEVVVLDGEVNHRDSLMSDEEHAADETMMICVSRAGGRRLVLDL